MLLVSLFSSVNNPAYTNVTGLLYISPPPAQGHAPQTLRTTPGPTATVVALTVREASLPPGGADGPRPDGGGGGRHGAGAPPHPEALQ